MPQLIPYLTPLIVQYIAHYAHLIERMYELCYDYSYLIQYNNPMTLPQVQLIFFQRSKNPAPSSSMSLWIASEYALSMAVLSIR